MGRTSSTNVARSQLATVHCVTVVTVGTSGAHRGRDFAEDLARAEERPRSHSLLRDRGEAGQQHEEAIVALVLGDEPRSRRDDIPPHALRQPSQRLAW